MRVLLLIVALVLCAIALWVFLPPCHAALVRFAVAAPELTPWLLPIALLVCAWAFPSARADATASAVFMLAGAVSVLLEIPLAEHAFDPIPNGLSGQIALYYTDRFLARALR
jgi:hypothetical protein